MNVNLFFNWLWIGELLTFKTGPPCIKEGPKIVYLTEKLLTRCPVIISYEY